MVATRTTTIQIGLQPFAVSGDPPPPPLAGDVNGVHGGDILPACASAVDGACNLGLPQLRCYRYGSGPDPVPLSSEKTIQQKRGLEMFM